jgi:predicted ATP-dependent serine protease
MTPDSTQVIKKMLKIQDVSNVGGLFINNFKMKENLTIIKGKSQSGKTTLVLELIADLLRRGKKVLYISAEDAQSRMRSKFSNFNNLTCIRTLDLEEVFKDIDAAIENNQAEYIFVDDLIQYQMKDDEHNFATKSQLLSRLIPRLLQNCQKSKIAVFMITNEKANLNPSAPNLGPSIMYYCANTIIDIANLTDNDNVDSYALTIHKNRQESVFKENGQKTINVKIKRDM